MASKKGADRRKASPEELRQQLEADVQAYLTSGGKIHRIKEGISGEPGWKRPRNGYNPNTRVNIQLPISYGTL
jgi:hypothetical protein